MAVCKIQPLQPTKSLTETTQNWLANIRLTYLHENTHYSPAIVGSTLRESLVQLYCCVLLFLVVSYAHVAHEQVCKDFLVFGVVDGGISIHLGYFVIWEERGGR